LPLGERKDLASEIYEQGNLTSVEFYTYGQGSPHCSEN